MEDLIKVLTILKKYTNEYDPCYCGREVFCVKVPPDSISQEDLKALEDLRFTTEVFK